MEETHGPVAKLKHLYDAGLFHRVTIHKQSTRLHRYSFEFGDVLGKIYYEGRYSDQNIARTKKVKRAAPDDQALVQE